MKFTYNAYENLIKRIIKKGYQITDYHSYQQEAFPCILRHDVDMNLEKAAIFAEKEAIIEKGTKATYFILLSSDFYNPFSRENIGYLKKIQSYGHEIGLHFDEKKYINQDDFNQEYISECVKREAEILSGMLENPVNTVSMHRPSASFLENNIETFSGTAKTGVIINSYAPIFFNEFKYVSDSRMCWRENVEEIVESAQERALHILTHPFWYFSDERNIKSILAEFIKEGKQKRYITLEDNLKDLKEILTWEEVK